MFIGFTRLRIRPRSTIL